MTGYLRGRVLSVNGLVHLPGWGDFQMSQIDAANDPYTLTATGGARKKGSDGMVSSGWIQFNLDSFSMIPGSVFT